MKPRQCNGVPVSYTHLENPADTSFDLEPLVFKSLKKKLPELRDAIDGDITPEQAGKLKVIKSHYENLEACLLYTSRCV